MKTILSHIIDSDFKLHPALIQCQRGVVNDILIVDDWNLEFLEHISYDLREYVLLPQFFNIHCHLGESLYEISPDEMANLTIERYIKLTEDINKKLHSDERDLLWSKSAHLTAELQKDNCISGICAARCAEICSEHALLAMSGYPLMNSVKLRNFAIAGINAFTTYIKEHKSPNCTVGLFFHSLYTNGNPELTFARDAMRLGAEFLSVHISEDYPTRQKELYSYGKSPIDVLLDYDLLSSRTLIIHGGFLDESDLLKIADADAVVVVCPISNLTLNTHMPDLYKIRKLGIRWCLATDGLITGKSFSILAQARQLKQRFPELTYEEIFSAVTATPANVFNRNIYSGVVRKGAEAKFILLPKEQSVSVLLNELFNSNELKQLIV